MVTVKAWFLSTYLLAIGRVSIDVAWSSILSLLFAVAKRQVAKRLKLLLLGLCPLFLQCKSVGLVADRLRDEKHRNANSP